MDGHPTMFANFDDGTPAPEIADNEGNYRKLGLILPATYPAELPRLTAIPGFRVWTRQEIEEAIRTKPFKARDIFKGSDWIENQQNVGSCCPTAETAASRKAAYFAGANEVPKLSAEFLYAQVNRNSDSGALLDETQKAGHEVGHLIRDDAKHPFNKHIFKKHYTAEDYRDAQKWRTGTAYQIDTELELATLILSKAGGAVVAVDVDNSFMNLNSDRICGGGRGPGNHAVNPDDVEIINGQLAFDMANSWGLSYGDGGRAYLTWEKHFKTTVKNHRFFVILGSDFQIIQDEGTAVRT